MKLWWREVYHLISRLKLNLNRWGISSKEKKETKRPSQLWKEKKLIETQGRWCHLSANWSIRLHDWRGLAMQPNPNCYASGPQLIGKNPKSPHLVKEALLEVLEVRKEISRNPTIVGVWSYEECLSCEFRCSCVCVWESSRGGDHDLSGLVFFRC